MRSSSPLAAEDRLALLLTQHAKLIKAARVAIAAARDGLADPTAYLEAELGPFCGLPPQDATVPAVQADARTAMTLAQRATQPCKPMAVAS
jgi:hypothetical protein